MDAMLFLIFSSAFLLLSMLLSFRSEMRFYYRLFFVILVLLSSFLNLFFYVSNYFTGEGFSDAVFLQLSFGIWGAGFWEYFKLLTISVITITPTIFVCFKIIFRKKISVKSNSIAYYAFILLFLSFALNPGVRNLYAIYSENNLINYENQSLFYNYYNTSGIVQISKQKNLVFIFAESFEQTYFNQSLFPGLVPNMADLQSHSLYFTNINTIKGTQISIAGQVGSLCGIPLISLSSSYSLSGTDKFLPNALCLGDLLNQSGYDLTFLEGSREEFSGTNKFFLQHGFSNLSGYNDLKKYVSNKSYHNDWGLYDDTLFNITLNKFYNLSQSNKSFGLFLATIDTHHPSGYISKSCINMTKYENRKNSILNAVSCFDYDLSNFVHKIIDSPYYNDTVIVIISDHIALRNTAFYTLTKVPRKDLFMILDSSIKNVTVVRNLGFKYDVGTTILKFLGYEGNIGLGRSIISENYNYTEIKKINSSIKYWKEDIVSLWSFPSLNTGIIILKDRNLILISTNYYRLPVLIRYDEKLNSKVYLNHGLKDGFHFNITDGIIWVHICKIQNDSITSNQSYSGYCLTLNKNGNLTTAPIITDKFFVSGRELRNYI